MAVVTVFAVAQNLDRRRAVGRTSACLIAMSTDESRCLNMMLLVSDQVAAKGAVGSHWQRMVGCRGTVGRRWWGPCPCWTEDLAVELDGMEDPVSVVTIVGGSCYGPGNGIEEK